MNVCANCFKDAEIKQFIESSSDNYAICGCCGIQSKVIALSELSDFLEAFLKLFIKNDKGNDLIQYIQRDWGIFSSDECAQKILSLIANNERCGFSVNDKVLYSPDIQECISEWDRLKTEVK